MKAGKSHIIRCHTFWGHFCKSDSITTLSSQAIVGSREIFFVIIIIMRLNWIWSCCFLIASLLYGFFLYCGWLWIDSIREASESSIGGKVKSKSERSLEIKARTHSHLISLPESNNAGAVVTVVYVWIKSFRKLFLIKLSYFIVSFLKNKI